MGLTIPDLNMNATDSIFNYELSISTTSCRTDFRHKSENLALRNRNKNRNRASNTYISGGGNTNIRLFDVVLNAKPCKDYVANNYYKETPGRKFQDSTDIDAPLYVTPLRVHVPADARAGNLPVEFKNWTIERISTKRDSPALHRLLISSIFVEERILPYLDDRSRQEIDMDNGVLIKVLDYDMGIEVEMRLKRWPSTQRYGLMENWKRDFVCRRGLDVGDEVGLSWDEGYNRLVFSVFCKSSSS